MKALAIVVAYTLAGSFIILKIVDLIFNLRVSAEEKKLGQDYSQHGENVQAFDMKNRARSSLKKSLSVPEGVRYPPGTYLSLLLIKTHSKL